MTRAGRPRREPRESRPRGGGRAPVPVPLRGIAALFLERQHLDRPLGRRLTAASLTRFAADVAGIQLDTINVVERAHHLTLWSRFGPYDRRTLDRLAYRRRLLYEYWAHAACLVPIADLPMWRHAMSDLRWTRRAPAWRSWTRRHHATLRAVEEAIREHGPLSSADFEDPTGRRRGGWWDRKPATHALDYLWMSGRTAVHSRANFQKRYDLAERVLSNGAGAAAGEGARDASVDGNSIPSQDEFWRWHLRRSLRAMGAATDRDLMWYLTFPGASTARRRAALADALREGEAVVVAPEGGPAGPRWLALAEDLPALERAARRREPSPGTTLLSPFDSLLWHRDRVRRLFGFDYTIEVYVPAPKRRHGYYSLPILHDGRMIGRLDPKMHREARRLEIRSVHFEPWFAQGATAPGPWGGVSERERGLAGVASALASLATFVGADEITLGPLFPRALASPLRAAVRRATS